MSDAFLVPLRASEHSYDFHKPVTVRTLRRFDPDLRLLRNRRNAAFEIHRVTWRTRRVEIDGFGRLSWTEPMLIYVCDWSEGLEACDDPTMLIRYLEAGDTLRNPHLNEDREYAVELYRYKLAEKSRENFRHAFRDNRRLLMRAYEPLVNTPNLVR